MLPSSPTPRYRDAEVRVVFGGLVANASGLLGKNVPDQFFVLAFLHAGEDVTDQEQCER